MFAVPESDWSKRTCVSSTQVSPHHLTLPLCPREQPASVLSVSHTAALSKGWPTQPVQTLTPPTTSLPLPSTRPPNRPHAGPEPLPCPLALLQDMLPWPFAIARRRLHAGVRSGVRADTRTRRGACGPWPAASFPQEWVGATEENSALAFCSYVAAHSYTDLSPSAHTRRNLTQMLAKLQFHENAAVD